MTDSSPTEPRYDEGLTSTTRQVAASDWTRAEIEAETEPPPKRERLFPRKVLIGWALFALALYFGVRVIGAVIKESVGEAVTTAAQQSGTKEIIYRTPNGRITISRNKPNGAITITMPPVTKPEPAAPAPAASTPTPKAAPKAPETPTPTPAPKR